MPRYSKIQLPKPANEDDFEDNCTVLFQEILKDTGAHRLGSRGHRQDGVDIVGNRDRDPNTIVGIQCRLKTDPHKLTTTEVKKLVEMALAYQPQLNEYFIVTTSSVHPNITKLAQKLQQDIAATGRTMSVTVWGWKTLLAHVDEHDRAKRVWDPYYDEALAASTAAAHEQSEVFRDLSRKVADLSGGAQGKVPLPTADDVLGRQLQLILRRRGFPASETKSELAILAERAINGDLSLASSALRSEVCDRAARASSVPASKQLAADLRRASRALDPARDLFLAEAFAHEAEGNVDATIEALGKRSDVGARSALINVLLRQKGAKAALDWVAAEQVKAADLDVVGRFVLLSALIQQARYDDGLKQARLLGTEDLEAFPALRLSFAQLAVASIVPRDRKASLFQGLPINPRALKLTAGKDNGAVLKEAIAQLRALLDRAEELKLGHLEDVIGELLLWFQLLDPDTEQAARAQIAKEVSDKALTLHRVRLALAYDVPFNKEALQRYLDSKKDLEGWTPEERFVALLLACHRGNDEAIANFFERHHEDLFSQEHLALALLAEIEIEALAGLKRFEEAFRHIEIHEGKLGPERTTKLKEQLEQFEKGDEVGGIL